MRLSMNSVCVKVRDGEKMFAINELIAVIHEFWQGDEFDEVTERTAW